MDMVLFLGRSTTGCVDIAPHSVITMNGKYSRLSIGVAEGRACPGSEAQRPALLSPSRAQRVVSAEGCGWHPVQSMWPFIHLDAP